MAELTHPMSSDDLRAIADALDEANAVLFKNGQVTELGMLIDSIEITAPDTDFVIGQFVCEDGWIGFRPYGTS